MFLDPGMKCAFPSADSFSTPHLSAHDLHSISVPEVITDRPLASFVIDFEATFTSVSTVYQPHGHFCEREE